MKNADIMTENKGIEISEFTIRYDGIYKIEIELASKNYWFYVYLPPDQLFTLMQKEGILSSHKENDFYDPVKFTKTTIVLYEVWVEKDNRVMYLPDAMAEEYQDILGINIIGITIK